jgi:protein-S-isoprenylcysteine O-methyltransferase Ste14
MASEHRKKTFNPLKILLRIPVPWVYVLTYLVGTLLQVILPFSVFSLDSIMTVKITGIALFSTGAILAAWSLLIFHRARTTTTPGESSKKLVMNGPYRFTRNPMYVSLIFAYIGEAGILTQIWPILVLPLILAYVDRVVVPLEEKVLKQDFAEEYENYCARVHRWL